MSLARVWNDNTRVYNEKFDDTEIVIPAKSYVEMPQTDAVRFMGQFVPCRKLNDGSYSNPKMLRMELVDKSMKEDNSIRCHACNKSDFKSSAELEIHVAELHKHLLVEDEAKEKLGKKKV